MDDIISRQSTIDAIEHVTWYHQNRNGQMVSGANSDEHQAWYKAEDVYEVIEALPSANRSGKWIERQINGTFKIWRCNKCGWNSEGAFNYCPNCGARMKGADDE